MLNRGWIWLVWIGLIALATWLRVGGITERPIHADEATGAKIAAQRLEGVGYAFNPKHFHGPWLSLSTVPIAQVRNETTWQELSLGTLRSNSALAGILLVLTPLLWVRRLGAIPSIVASSLLATSPLLVYYSQMYIHESWLALFGFISLAALYRLWTQPSKTNGCLAGLCLGLMFVTKETVAISILSWGATLGLCSLLALKGSIKNTPGPHEYLKPLLCLSFVALVIAAIFYTNGFQHPAGLYEAFRTYFVYETTAGHEKPLGYYLGLLIWPKHTLGIWWSEGLVLLLALLAGLAALQFKQYFKAITFLLIAGTTHLAIYSSISYKNPWLMLLPWAHFCLLAGTAFCDFKRATRPLQVSLLTLLVATLIFQTKQSLYATGRLANDARNPYSYVPTTKDPQR
ncbi:MAG: glycosyltransferase family 39 protein, partial [Coraliomargarita sp.]